MSASILRQWKWGWWLALAGTLLVYLPIILNLTAVPYYREAEYSDLLISHLPNAIFVRESWVEWGQLPLWNPTIFSGTPFAADPLAGMAYLPNWITFALPRPLTFNLLNLIHLCWAAAGCYVLARKINLTPAAGVIAAVAFAGTPKMTAHLGLGHISLVNAVCWTPWLLAGVQFAVASISEGKQRGAVLTGFVLGCIFLIDPRWSIPGFVLGGAYALNRWMQTPSELRGTPRQVASSILITGIFSLGIAALLAIPLWEFLSLSTRKFLPASAGDIFALDWAHLLGLFHPILAQPEQVTYLGVSVLVLGVMGFASRKKGSAFWAIIFIASLVLSLGGATPLYTLFAGLFPGAGLLRVPARMFYISALSSAILAGYGVSWIMQGDHVPREKKVIRLMAWSIGILIVGVNIAFLQLNVARAIDGFLGSMMTLAIVLTLELKLRGKLIQVSVARILWTLIVIELFWVSRAMLRLEAYPGPIDHSVALGENLPPGTYGARRFFSPSYAIPQLAAVRAKLELADGINPLMLATYHDYLQEATGFRSTGYSVTLPPFPPGDPKQPWPVDLDPALLSRLNVSHIVSDYPLRSSGLTLVGSEEERYIYALAGTRPRAWLEWESRDSWTAVEIVRWTPNQIQIRADGEGLLVLSEISYPGWRAAIDGQSAPITTSENIFRAVDLPPGDHFVEFWFIPITIYLGILSFCLTSVLGIILWWKR